MNRRSRNLLLVSSTFVTGGLLFGLACDPNYPKQGAGGGTGGQSTTGTGGQTASGTGGQSTTGTGGQTASGTGGQSTTGTGGQTASGTGGQSTTGTGGQTASGTGGQTGTGGSGATNLITNRDFSNSDTGWMFTVEVPTGGTAPHGVMNGEYCVTVAAGQQLIIGWPVDTTNGSFHLVSGTSYTFSYQASTSSTAVINVMDAKVGQDVTPYTADFEQKTDPLGTSLQTVSHTFTATANDDSGGIGFFVNGPATGTATAQVCVDNVSLVAN